jgi:hypothetical protein
VKLLARLIVAAFRHGLHAPEEFLEQQLVDVRRDAVEECLSVMHRKYGEWLEDFRIRLEDDKRSNTRHNAPALPTPEVTNDGAVALAHTIDDVRKLIGLPTAFPMPETDPP